MRVKMDAELEATVRAALDAAERSRETQWIALHAQIAARDALAVFEASEARDRFYWERPDEGRAIAALGCAGAIEVDGQNRFDEASRRAARVFERVHACASDASAAAGPLLVGGFAFANAASGAPHWRGFPAGRLVLPELTLRADGDRGRCTLVRPVEPPPAGASEARAPVICAQLRADLDAVRRLSVGRSPIDASSAEAGGPLDLRVRADLSHAEYRAQVEAALREIAAGGFEKAVVARCVCVRGSGDWDPSALLDALRRAHPSCAVFAVARASATFLGATPECLLRVADGRVETASVAGSAPRGRNPEEDAELGRQLRESKKEQAEHAFVVRALREALAPHCEALEVRESPRLMRLQDIQHLETPISGILRARASILDLLGSVHPTPAVAGAPREAALRWLSRCENLDRGWYSGPVGFVESDGAGEFYAALRSVVMRENEARLFAGAGVVADSDPEAELRETRLKLRAVLGPLMAI